MPLYSWDYRRKNITLVYVHLAALFRAPLLPRASRVLAGCRYATLCLDGVTCVMDTLFIS
ncbi:MAG: hypothetical protein ACK55Z_26395 [bacterium]